MFEGLYERSRQAEFLGQLKVLDSKICEAKFYQKKSVEMNLIFLLTQEQINDLESEFVLTEFLGLIDGKYSYKFTFKETD